MSRVQAARCLRFHPGDWSLRLPAPGSKYCLMPAPGKTAVRLATTTPARCKAQRVDISKRMAMLANPERIAPILVSRRKATVCSEELVQTQPWRRKGWSGFPQSPLSDRFMKSGSIGKTAGHLVPERGQAAGLRRVWPGVARPFSFSKAESKQ